MLKKLLICVLIVCMTTFSFALADTSPFSEIRLPDGMADAFPSGAWVTYGPIAYALSPEENEACVAMRSNGRNVLCVMELKDGAWKIVMKSASPLYQGKRCPILYYTDVNEFTVAYGVSEYDSSNDDYETYSFERKNGVYRAVEYACAYATDRAEDVECILSDTGLEYSTWSLEGDSIKTATVKGVIERSLQYFNISLFPKSPEEAKLSLSNPDTLPKNSALTKQNVKLTAGKKYPVYSAPFADSLRAADGKATLSTNDWVSVFGQDGDWLLVEYDISSDHSRFGYITASALPKDTNVDELIFVYRDACVTDTAAITDDPLRSRSRLWTVYAGEYVTYLADLGDGWAYVEYLNGSTLLRGFMRQELLNIL